LDKEKLINRGNEADRLLKSELWQEAWKVYRLKVFAAIENAKTDEGTIRGKLMLGIANDVRNYLEGVMKDGAFAANDIKLEEERKKRRWPFAA
jgi:hypothetical protein